LPIVGRRRQNRSVPKLEPRLAVLTALMLAALSAVAVRLYYLQIINTQEMTEMADRNRIRTRRVPAPRGLVYDRRHRPLIDTRPSFDAVMVPEDAGNLHRTIDNFERYVGEDHVAEKLGEAKEQGRPPFDAIAVKERLTWDQVVAIEAHQLELPGVSLQVTPRRRYLYGPMAAHLLGYVGEVSERELSQLAGYHLGDEVGKFGLERGWEGFLRGTAGGQEMEVDSVGRRLRLLKEVPEEPGQSVVLTLDLDLQQVAEQSLGERSGAVIAIDPNNGDILAMASHPSFDPNRFASGIVSADWRKLINDPGHPLENRVISGAYPPGSTFKIVDTVAGMSEGTLNASTTYFCPGGIWFGNREYRCWRKQGHGTLAYHRALVESCDVYFYDVGQRLGIDRIAHWGHLLGLGINSGIDLDNERPGVMPSTQWKQKRFHERWYPAETLSVAIGQGYVAVTPIQLAQMVAQVANNGVRYKPHFVHQIEGLDGRVLKAYPPEIEANVAIDPQILKTLRDAMADVIEAPNGTAHKDRLNGIVMCGKTGTAQVIKQAQGERIKEEKLPERYRDHAWFVAYAPKDHPMIAIACIVEHGGHGGSAAAPVVHDIMQKFFQLNPPAPDSIQAPNPVPNPAPNLTKASAGRIAER
jgi:penicillin-binding protein 2